MPAHRQKQIEPDQFCSHLMCRRGTQTFVWSVKVLSKPAYLALDAEVGQFSVGAQDLGVADAALVLEGEIKGGTLIQKHFFGNTTRGRCSERMQDKRQKLFDLGFQPLW